MIDLRNITGFDRDAGNRRKNDKHDVTTAEAEHIFFNKPLLMLQDHKHSIHELHLHALGQTDGSRLLHITFTLRDSANTIRVISARDMHRKERKIYENTA